MNRETSSDPAIGRHIDHYRRILSASTSVKLSSFEDTFLTMNPLIQSYSYVSTRLPEKIYSVKKIIIGTKLDVSNSIPVTSLNRRRLMYLDDFGTLSVQLNSYSDLDDIINNLLSYRIEYHKIKTQKLADYPEILDQNTTDFDPSIELLPMNIADFSAQADEFWRQNITKSLYFDLANRPVYFVSSNFHSLTNIIGGYLNLKQNYLFDYIAKKHTRIYDTWFAAKASHDQSEINDFLFYIASLFLQENDQFIADKKQYENNLGIINLPAKNLLPINLQVIPLKSLAKSPNLDPNLRQLNLAKLSENDAVIINVQYPLGEAAKYLLDSFIKNFTNIKGIYIIGKAAILKGSVGDIQIPEIVMDETTNNTYRFDNIFNHYFPYKGIISHILQNQKSACVYGTLLENQNQIDNYKKANFNIIEMESGPYLASILENFQLHQSVSQSFVYQLQPTPFDFGIINYASDNPLTENLSQESIDFRGIETTYLSSLNVLSRIIELENH